MFIKFKLKWYTHLWCTLESKNFRNFMGRVVKDVFKKTLLNAHLYDTS